MRPLLPALLAATMACGGNGGGGGTPPPPSPNPPNTGSQNPCSTAETAGEDLLSPPDAGRPAAKAAGGFDGSTRWRVLEDLWIHRQAEARAASARREGTAPADAIDIGSISVLQDEGDLLASPNPWDLRSTGVRFSRNASGGYDVRQIDGAFRQTLGTRLTLADDDTSRVDVPFGFQFYGRSETAAYVNSDGNVTFGDGDTNTTERNVARLLTGPPRVAPFLADLDPSTGGTVFVHAAGDQYTVTWCGVRAFESPLVTTTQATLLPDGSVEMKYGGTITIPDAVVGISPGTTAQFTAADLSAAGPISGGAAAVGERFAASAQLDTVAVARKFLRTHADVYDQLVIWTDVPVVRDAFAYETTVANEIRGLGIDVYDLSNGFGSGGRLRSLAIMDHLGKYPDDPNVRFLREGSTLAVLAHEVAHRWLAFFSFRDHRGETSDELLGRGMAHWSFFADTDASVMEGNDIQDLAGGAFRTIGAMNGYSTLDLYAMGLLAESEVPPFFYVEDPVNVSPPKSREAAPALNVTLNGTRRDVLIQDIVAANGPRIPSSAESPRVHAQAFIYVSGAGRSAAASQIEKLDRIRREWEAYFFEKTGRRMRVTTELR